VIGQMWLRCGQLTVQPQRMTVDQNGSEQGNNGLKLGLTSSHMVHFFTSRSIVALLQFLVICCSD